jgi:class 3 adenylate cyclase/PAS domain-containing protein
MWKIMIVPLYEELFMPMFESITTSIDDEISAVEGVAIPVIIVIILAGCLVEVFAFLHCRSIEIHIRSVLKLLLHVHPDVVTANARIMAVLGGDFSGVKGDLSSRDGQFFDEVFDSLPDAVIYADTGRTIEGANECSKKLFGTEDMVGRDLADFYNNDRFNGNLGSLFTASGAVTLMTRVDGSEIYYEVSFVGSADRIVISAEDVTQTVRYNTLIAEERAKSDELLASILPPSLVKRVQAGEKNISFAVQSASISFIDIVEFTPWCGSLPAATVMRTLNALFAKFDANLAKRATMTKIKCIGDCYMAAAGIFSEVNQPAVHAKEMVMFGINAITSIDELNGEVNQHLRIRVGINTGGPIVAGVLGIGKPTFEILGPTINMAQQMEHHGVPMMVHISRAVYELVYGDTFEIKERGATVCNTGTYITYLVTPNPVP